MNLYRFILYVEQDYSFDILRPIYDCALAQGHDVRWLLVGKSVSPHLIKFGESHIESFTDAVQFDAHAVFVPGDRVPSFLPGLKVQVFHGLNESKRGNVYPERGMFDLYCTEGHERTNTLLEIAKKRKYFRVAETGWVKLDSLFKSRTNLPNFSKPVIFFASTFSPSLSCAEYIYEEIKRLSATGKWHWLVTLHPKMNEKTKAKYRSLESENLEYCDTNKVLEMMHVADVMVCDNSSILQEFLLLGKPVVTVNNREPLKSFIDIKSGKKLNIAIEKALNPSEELKEEIKNYGSSVTPYLSGSSAYRIIEATKEMIDSNWIDRKPKNIIRNIKIRFKLKYWSI